LRNSRQQKLAKHVSYCCWIGGGVRVTDLERTLADSIEDMDKISGIEEIISMIRQIRKIDEKNYVSILMSGIKISFIKRRAGCLKPMGM